MTRHLRAAAERWNARIQEHALAGHPARALSGLEHTPGTKEFCGYCRDAHTLFRHAIARLASTPAHLKEAQRI